MIQRCILLVGLAVTFTQITIAQELPAFEYAVKFVCGKAEGDVVAAGTYFTAINVHNPGTRGMGIRKKFAVALHAERPGPVSRFFDAKLGPDQAFEIDCSAIFHRSEPQSSFLRG